MAQAKEMGDLYELILLSPGLKDNVKLDSKVSGRAVLLLTMALEYAMSEAAAGSPLKKIMSVEDQDVLRGVMEEMLGKAGLKEFYERLKRYG